MSLNTKEKEEEEGKKKEKEKKEDIKWTSFLLLDFCFCSISFVLVHGLCLTGFSGITI